MIITGGTFFVAGRFQTGLSLRMEGGRITEMGNLVPWEGEQVYDAKDRYVLPGFVDIHIHGFDGVDMMSGEAALRHMAKALKTQGVGAFLPTTMSASMAETRTALAGVAAVMARPGEGAAVLGAHLEAPFLSLKHAGAQVKGYFLAPSLEAYDELTAGFDGVARLITLAPELPGAQTLIEALVRRGVVVSGGHTAATAEELHQAADWGLTQVTHLFNAQTPLHHRLPGVPGAALTDERIAVQVIADLIHLHPDIVRLSIAAKRGCPCHKGVLLITDAMMAAGMPEGQYELGGQCVYVKDGAARLAEGNLAGSTLTQHQALKNVIGLGIKPEEAIPMLTQGPADSIGARDYGRIALGAKGAFAVMDGEWNLADAI